jgi:hypothetical protein
MFEIFAALSNITTTLGIPVQITPYFGPAAGTAAAAAQAGSSSILNDTSIIAVLGPAAAGVYAFVKNKFSDNKQYHRASALVDNQERTVNSLKSSDMAAKDDALGVNALVMKLCEDPNLNKLLTEPTDANHGLNGMSVAEYIKEQTDGWEKSNNAYYNNSNPMPGENSPDPIVAKAATISKLTTPTLS